VLIFACKLTELLIIVVHIKYTNMLIKNSLKIITLTLILLTFSKNSFSNETFLNGWEGYVHIEQAETKYKDNAQGSTVDNSNPGQPFTRGHLSLNKNFNNSSTLIQYDLSYEGYNMETRDNDATGYILSNKLNFQKNSNILNYGLFANYSENGDRGDNLAYTSNFWHYGAQINKFFDNTNTKAGISYGEVRGEDFFREGIANNGPGNNYNFYVQQYFKDNLRIGYSLNLLDGERDNGSRNTGNRAHVSSHLVNIEYYLSEKYPVALTASYEIINYRPGQNETDWPHADEFKLGIKYIFGGEKTLMAFDKGRISHQANVENYWTHLANEIE